MAGHHRQEKPLSKTLLVTGGAGFIGSNFVHYWMQTRPDDRVCVLDALTYAGNPDNLKPVWSDPRFRFYPGRIEDPTVVNGIFRIEKPTHVLNFAAESHVDRSLLDPTGLIAANVTGVTVLMEAARRYGIERMAHISTDEIYGETTPDKPFGETDPLEPRSPYSAGKAGGEMQVRAHRIAYGTPVIVTRGSNTFGPYQFPEKILPFFITRAMQDKKLPVYGSGEQKRDWIFVRDHCSGIATALEKGVLGEAYNVGGGNERQNIEVTRKVLALLGKPESLIKHIGDPRGKAHDKGYFLKTSRLRALGWRPARSFDEALGETVRWYVENEGWWRPIVESAGYRDYVARYYGPYLGEDL
jgi:dTDP-glucose 4,6-dehydratase